MTIEVDIACDNSNPTTSVKPKLAHESLHSVAQSVRFGIAGFLSNVTFLAVFNILVDNFANHETLPASRIYSVWYCFYIPIGHAINALLVFGWPDPYLPSLLSNAPIGLTAMAIGTLLTGYFDRIHFDHTVETFLASTNLPFVGHQQPVTDDEEEPSEFYSSLVVLAVTGVFSYLASVYVNSGASGSQKGGEKKKL